MVKVSAPEQPALPTPPAAPPPPPVFGQSPVGTKSGQAQSASPSFLNSSALPSSSQGGKKLVGT